MRVLSISTLFPNPVRPTFGIFVGNQMKAVVARGDVDLTMISPLGIAPFPLSRREPYASLATVPRRSKAAGLPVLYPQFTLIPKIGGDSNPRGIARVVLPLARELHAQAPFDLVDAQFFFPDGPAAAIVAEELGLPLTVKSRGADIHYWGARPKARQQMLDAANHANRLLAVSEALGRDMVALGMPKGRIRVHYTGLDRGRFHPRDRAKARKAVAASLGIPETGPLVVTPGALIERKGQRLVIEALSRLPGARLALAGGGGDEAALRALANNLGLAERVHFLGIVTHDVLPALLCAGDVMALPSASEGLANAWVEALGCGTPIVITDVGGASELVTSPSAGQLVERSADAVAQGIAAVLADPPAQADVAANADRFSWDRNAENLVEIWREAIDGYAGAR
jgi:glycosyltransferase involved in cell wall biosynthesis